MSKGTTIISDLRSFFSENDKSRAINAIMRVMECINIRPKQIGTEKKINCQFTLTRRNSDEYEVSYTGQGFYTFNGEIPGTITHVNINQWPNGEQHITTKDIVTSQLNADGKVALKYDTVIRKIK